MADIEEIDRAILTAVHEGRLSAIPDSAEDSGHVAWLVGQGYLANEKGTLTLTEKGQRVLALR